MTRLEMVEKIREKSGVTYDVAKAALEKADWDMLDALISLENSNFSAAQQASAAPSEENYSKRVSRKANINVSDMAAKVSVWLRYALKFINKGEAIRLEINRKDETIESVSLTVIILLFIIKWWLPVGLIILGFVTGFRYRLLGAGRIGEAITRRTNSKADAFKSQMTAEDSDE